MSCADFRQSDTRFAPTNVAKTVRSLSQTHKMLPLTFISCKFGSKPLDGCAKINFGTPLRPHLASPQVLLPEGVDPKSSTGAPKVPRRSPRAHQGAPGGRPSCGWAVEHVKQLLFSTGRHENDNKSSNFCETFLANSRKIVSRLHVVQTYTKKTKEGLPNR